MTSRTTQRVLNRARDMEEPWRDRAILLWLYRRPGASLSDVAEDLGTTPTTIQRWLKRYRIATKPSGWPTDNPGRDPKYADVLTEAYLRREYVEKERSTCDIASEVGCNDVTVGRYLRRHDIRVRSAGDAGGV